jgi:hypothetical protein
MFLETLYQVELSHVPFPDEPPVVYPAPEVWKALTERRAQYASVSLETTSPAERKIRAALDQETRLEFPGVPLREALNFLADIHDINIVIDEVTLTDAGVSLDDNVDIVLTGITLRSALRILLEPYDVTYVIEDEVMKITTQKIAAERFTTAAYDLESVPGIDEDGFEEKLQRLLDPLPGQKSEEGAERRPRIERFGGRLLVTGPQAEHERLQEYLELLRFRQ